MALRDHSTLSEIGVMIAFLSAVVTVLYFEVRWLFLRWYHRKTPTPPRFWPFGPEKALTVALNVVAAAGMLCIVYGFLIGPTDLEVTRLEVPTGKVAGGRVRIVHLSDIHSETYERNEGRAAELVNALEPDLILMTGDYLNETGALPIMRRFVSALRPGMGIFAVKGNMDLGGNLPEDAFTGLPVELLDRQSREVVVRGSRLRISGLEVGEEPYFKRWWRPAPAGAFEIFLFHYTDLVYEAEEAGVELYLAGHTHGGQIRLPFYGALVTLAKLGKRFEAGRYRLGLMTLYVSRGLGMEGGRAPRVRFLCRPEVTVLDLVPEGKR